MLLIAENENPILPKEFHLINDICAIIYDQITDLLANSSYDPYFKHTAFTVNPELHQSIEGLGNGDTHVLDWLAQNNMNDEVCTTLTKHISLSILSDFANFVYESLSCAKKGKISVAYSLLRKPFTDELLLLEQLLSNKEDFIQKFFYNGDPEHYDPASRNIRRNKKEKEIIENAVQKLTLDSFLSPEIIYSVRYDKSFANGINGMTNKALHIVTTDNNYKTLNQNLNFIFSSGPGYYEKHCEHFFYFVPILLIYSAAIADELLFQYLPEEEHKIEKVLRSFKRLVAYSFLHDKGNETLLDALSQTLQYKCEDCNRNKDIDKADYELFLRTGLFVCDKCFKPATFTIESIDPIRQLISFKSDDNTAI